MTFSAASHPAASWADQRLIAAFALGKTPDLHLPPPPQRFSGGQHGPNGGGRKPGPKPVIHAWLIRELLLSDPVPGQVHQVRVREADIQGILDLRFAKTECALRLEHCTFENPVRLSEARMRSVSLCHSTIPEIDARHLTVTGDLVLDDVRVAGRVRLGGAHLGDDLHLSHARIGSPEARASRHRPAAGGSNGDVLLDLQNIDVRGMIEADHLTVYGQVSTAAATVAGTVRMTNLRIGHVPDRAPGPARDMVAWSGNGMKTEGTLNVSGLHANGQVNLIDAQVRGLVMHQAQVTNSGYALLLDRLSSRGSVFIDKDSHLLGGIHAIGMQVGASLYLRSCQVRAPISGSDDDKMHALDLRRAKIGDDVRCDKDFRATGACNLASSHITGRLALTGARLWPAKGTARPDALIADSAHIGGDLYCRTGFTARGTMSLVNAKVGGGVTIAQDTQCRGRVSLAGAGLSVGRNLTLDVAGTVDLSGADVSGDLTIHLGRLGSQKDKAAADLSDVKADDLTIHGRPTEGFLDLTRARVTRLLDDPAAWPLGSKLVLDGLEYSAIGAIDEADGDRLGWLETGTQWVRSAAGAYDQPGFTPQPYLHLAALYQQAGDDRYARKALHAMYRRHNKVKVRFWNQPIIKTWNIVQDVFLGYGYVPSLAVSWLAVLAIATTIWFADFGHLHRGIVESAILSLGMVLPGSGYDKLEAWGKGGSTTAQLVAAGLVMCGLLLGASVIAALGRAIKR